MALVAELLMHVAPALPTCPVTGSTAQMEKVSCAAELKGRKKKHWMIIINKLHL